MTMMAKKKGKREETRNNCIAQLHPYTQTSLDLANLKI